MTDHIGNLAAMVHPADGDTDRFDLCFRRWFVGMVAAALDPKVVNHVILVLIGSALAWTDRGFHWLPAVLCLAFALLMQCTANLVNDLWDFLKGADQPDRLGPDRAFAKGYITLGAMKAGIAGFTLAACAAGVALLVWALHAGALRYGGWELVAAGAACIVFAWFYSAGPYPLAYHGLGDSAGILFFGLVPV